MLGLGIFKRKKEKQITETLRVLDKRRAENRRMVYEAVKAFDRPVSGQEVARSLNWVGGVFPRLTDLNRLGRIEIAYRKRGLDGVWRNYYEVTE